MIFEEGCASTALPVREGRYIELVALSSLIKSSEEGKIPWKVKILETFICFADLSAIVVHPVVPTNPVALATVLDSVA